MLFVEGEWYVKLFAYKFTGFVILKIFVFSNSNILCSRYPYLPTLSYKYFREVGEAKHWLTVDNIIEC